ncbi:hypothetical protein GCM10010406_46090 [Streptomyces thermolineatus]|uniref:Uncharacterized protein n=1 Tax=Streptomyces thermolineatus TaxID=44033 RepID=A0ABP5ZTS9_9ACTN
MVTDASGKGRPVGPCAPATVPSRRTTAAAAVSTGQFSITRRDSMPATVTVPARPPFPGLRLLGVHSNSLAW